MDFSSSWVGDWMDWIDLAHEKDRWRAGRCEWGSESPSFDKRGEYLKWESISFTQEGIRSMKLA